jgi:hypothetical protein
MPSPKIHMIPLDQIDSDPKYYPRRAGKADWLTVLVIRDALLTNPWKANPSNPRSFPPIVVVKPPAFRNKYLLIDGLHRWGGFHQAGILKIPAFIENLPKSQWLKRATELNIIGKRALGPQDKAHVTSMLLADGWKIEKIAEIFETKVETIEKIYTDRVRLVSSKQAKQLPLEATRLVGNQRLGVLKGPFKRAGNEMAALASQGTTSAMNVGQIIDQFIAMLESSSADLSNSEVYSKLVFAKELLDECLG